MYFLCRNPWPRVMWYNGIAVNTRDDAAMRKLFPRSSGTLEGLPTVLTVLNCTIPGSGAISPTSDCCYVDRSPCVALPHSKVGRGHARCTPHPLPWRAPSSATLDASEVSSSLMVTIASHHTTQSIMGRNAWPVGFAFMFQLKLEL